jgi:hypothetical protein
MTRDLHTVVTVDHTDKMRNIRDRTYNRDRTIHIRFTKEHGDAGYHVQAWGSAFPQDGGGGYQGHLAANVAVANSGINDLRAAWQHQVVGYIQRRDDGRNCFPFVENWNLSGSTDPDWLEHIGLKLARASHALFSLLFLNGDAGLKEIADHLALALRSDENVITMESDDLFVPWGMLYTPPKESDSLWGSAATWSLEGFWGYRHLIEHNFSRAPGFDSRVLIPARRVIVGLNVDERVDSEYPTTPCVQPVMDFFTDRTHVVVRRTKDELACALQDPLFSDHITYFCCHGQVSGATESPGRTYLKLTDDEEIYSTEFIGWLSRNPLPTRPVVFVNACQGGQMSSLFFPAFGHHLLHYGARCLIGPQIDLPRAFAREYATRLFTAFLESRTKLGDIVRALAREFANDYRNPLGLIFSLYRGIDVHLWLVEE